MKAFIERKESSSDLLSRYKARKMLGVGESSGGVVSSKVTQLLGDSNEVKLDTQDIASIRYWSYLMALLIFSFGLMILGFPLPYGDWFLERLFPVANIYNVRVPSESCSIQGSHNIRLIYMHFGYLHIIIASGMFYSLLVIKTNGIYMSQFLSSAYSLSFMTVHFVTKEWNWILFIYIILTIITIMFHVKLSMIRARGWISTIKHYFFSKLSPRNKNHSSNETIK
uniref:Tumor protein p53-inducible protein 11 n=1 Tax=Schistosoma japonicum TaxID=6182 RepID=C1LEG3_SCHJA|nr:hypotheticial protein [Schistosoma japonicum]